MSEPANAASNASSGGGEITIRSGSIPLNTAAPAATPAEPAETAAAATTAPAKRSLEDSLASLDEDTRKFVMAEVDKARREAASSRTNAKKSAADEARTELAQQIGKAIGLVPDEAADPAVLTEKLATQTQTARQAQVELAVYRAAGTEFDPAALLDSRSFATSLKDIDPNDGAAVTAAITAAAEANPAFKTAPTRRLPGPNPALGSSAAGAPSIDDQIAEAKKSGDVNRWMHLENQKLTAPSRQ